MFIPMYRETEFPLETIKGIPNVIASIPNFLIHRTDGGLSKLVAPTARLEFQTVANFLAKLISYVFANDVTASNSICMHIRASSAFLVVSRWCQETE